MPLTPTLFEGQLYSHALHNDIFVNDGLCIWWWSQKIIMELKNSYCLVMYCLDVVTYISQRIYSCLWYLVQYHAVQACILGAIDYTIQPRCVVGYFI